MLGAKTLELAHDGKSLLLQLDAEAARDQWVRAIDGALARFRRTATARPEPRKEVTEVENRKGWDAGIEERARLEVDARRAAVRAAGLALQEADRRLDAARAEHLEMDRDIRLRRAYPDATSDFIQSLPGTEPRDLHGYRKYEGGGKFGEEEKGDGGGVSLAEIEKMVIAARDKAENEAKARFEAQAQLLKDQVKQAQQAKFTAEQELRSYKELAFTSGPPAEEEPTNYDEMTPKQQADYDAAHFEGTVYADGLMTLPEGFFTDSRTIRVFSEGEDAVLLQDGETTLLRTRGRDEDDSDSGWAAKEPAVET
jgi:hypothetical protein